MLSAYGDKLRAQAWTSIVHTFFFFLFMLIPCSPSEYLNQPLFIWTHIIVFLFVFIGLWEDRMWTTQIAMTISSLKTWCRTIWTEESQWRNRLFQISSEENVEELLQTYQMSLDHGTQHSPSENLGGMIIFSILWLVSMENLFKQMFGSIMSQLNPSWQQSPAKLFTHLPPAQLRGTGERTERLKWENILDSDKNSFMDKEKATHTHRLSKIKHSFLWAGRHSDVSRTAGLQWLGKRNTSTLNVPLRSSSPHLFTEHDAIWKMAWKIPWIS